MLNEVNGVISLASPERILPKQR